MKVNTHIGGLLLAVFKSSGVAIELSDIEKAVLYFITPDFRLVGVEMDPSEDLEKHVAKLSTSGISIRGKYRAFAVVDLADDGGSLITPVVEAFDLYEDGKFGVIDFVFATSEITSTVRGYFSAAKLPKTNAGGRLFAWNGTTNQYDETETVLSFVAVTDVMSARDPEELVLDILKAYDVAIAAAETASDAAEAANEAAEAANTAAETIDAKIDAKIDEYLSVLAHADATLAEAQETLGKRVDDIVSGESLVESLNVRKLGVYGDNNLVIVGSGAPSAKPDRAGQFYIDTTNNAVYKSVDNSAVSDWKTV